VEFLAQMSALARQNESVFLQRRHVLGDPWKNEVYGYAYFQGTHGFLFLNNVHFAARKATLRLDAALGLEALPGTPLHVLSHFPERQRLQQEDGSQFRAGDTMEVWLRPFEVLLLEVSPSAQGTAALSLRSLSEQQAADLGLALPLQPVPPDECMDVLFADAARFEQQNHRKKDYTFEATLPSLEGEQPILAVAVRLRQGEAEWRYSPVVVEIVQVLARVGEQNVPLVPVPDARQFGNTQKAGCSWVLYKVRLNPQWSHEPLKIAVQAYLPEGVEAHTEAWVVRRWWEENTRPVGEGYYAEAPS
jgi:hypothetical protein